jgi:peptide/nickel transport system substrate-binding protein
MRIPSGARYWSQVTGNRDRYIIRMTLRASILMFLVVAACERNAPSSSFGPHGTMVISSGSDPDVIFPPLAFTNEGRQVSENIYEYLADVGAGLNTLGDTGFVKQLAERWTWSADSMAIAFSLRPDARWHDGARVTASDVRFTYRLYTDSVISSPTVDELEDIDSVSVRDSLTAIFWFKRRTPRQFFAAASQMLIMPEHVLSGLSPDSAKEAASHDPIGTGRYRLAKWTRGSYVELDAVRDHYRGEAGVARLIWTIAPDPATAVARLLGGEADFYDGLRRENIDQLEAKGDFNVRSLPGMDYAFMQFNLRDPAHPSSPHPLFASRDLRRAITMAIDRASIVRNLFDTLAAVNIGPTVRALPTTDTALKQIPYDPAAAEALLDSIGWRRLAPGTARVRAGKKLAFGLLLPSSSVNRMRAGVLLQEQLRKVGVDVSLDQMEFATFLSRLRDRKFNAALSSWTLGSTPAAVRVTWTSRAARPGGLNYGAYSNPRFDAMIDSALSTGNVQRAREYYRLANQTIIDDAPAVWLYEPRKVLGIHRRIRTPPLRPNAWWLDLGRWRIPDDEMIDRDRIGPPGTAADTSNTIR